MGQRRSAAPDRARRVATRRSPSASAPSRSVGVRSSSARPSREKRSRSSISRPICRALSQITSSTRRLSLVQRVGVVLGEDVRVAVDGAERRPQVVRHRVGERPERLVGGFELLRALAQPLFVFAPVGHVDQRAHQTDRLAAFVAEELALRGDPAHRPIAVTEDANFHAEVAGRQRASRRLGARSRGRRDGDAAGRSRGPSTAAGCRSRRSDRDGASDATRRCGGRGPITPFAMRRARA